MTEQFGLERSKKQPSYWWAHTGYVELFGHLLMTDFLVSASNSGANLILSHEKTKLVV